MVVVVVGCWLFVVIVVVDDDDDDEHATHQRLRKASHDAQVGVPIGPRHLSSRFSQSTRKIGAFHHPKVGVNPFTISITNCEQIWIQYMIVYDNSSLVWDNSTIVYNYHYYSPKVGGKIGKISMEFS